MTASTDHTYEEALQSLHFAAANADVPDAQLFGTLVTARAGRNELSLLGLSPDQFTGLLARQFPHLRSVDTVALTSAVAPLPLPATHSAFVATLHARLMDEANPAVARDDADCLAAIIAHACLRPDHLWRDLGLDGRDAVTAMLARFFPTLAARNVAHLRWKKFLAQEVAASLGVPPGPAPGCPGCEDFGFCFPRA
ncbi:NifQ [Burkholderia cenocepacia]|uniref:nitrogen fixation protein NifQ n=1 Tax=Burkholderia cenocepacia TaxID=95486 RepID=UPI000F59DC56|nr:nitrogen fixation protein NifQ [Burkholderia cenocepacia]QND98954.1 NifQ [Burkholderia cenocepacia]RQU79047.1 nitrogen fixation protein NifQ [Burkholderia cenocepacia]